MREYPKILRTATREVTVSCPSEEAERRAEGYVSPHDPPAPSAAPVSDDEDAPAKRGGKKK